MKEMIKKLRELHEKATKGKWEVRIEDGSRVMEIFADGHRDEQMCDGRIVETDAGFYPPRINDANLIAETRNALPKLLDYIEGLEKNNTKLLEDKINYRSIARSFSNGDEFRKLERDNALLLEVAKASIRMWNGGWDKEHQVEIESTYSTALKAAEAAMEGG